MVVRSVSTITSTAAGRLVRSCGSSVLIRSTTSITLAPGWRWMLNTMPGVRLAQAANRMFSASSITAAMSDIRTGAPLR